MSDPYHAMRIDGIADELGLDADRVAGRHAVDARRARSGRPSPSPIGRIIGYDRLVRLDERVEETTGP